MNLKIPVEHAPQGTDTRSMPGLKSKVQADHSISKVTYDTARYTVRVHGLVRVAQAGNNGMGCNNGIGCSIGIK